MAAVAAGIAFFGTCPTGWESLSPAEKGLCIGVPLTRKVESYLESYFAWTAAGLLLEQWNESGSKEFSAVIKHNESRKFHLHRHNIPSHELRLLSLENDPLTVEPYIVINSRDDKVAKETITRLEEHHRLSRIGFKYLVRKGNMKLTTDEPGNGDATLGNADMQKSQNHLKEKNPRQHVGADIQPDMHVENLCGARIAVYPHTGQARVEKRNVATIGCVLKLGKRCFALTVAHVFFDSIDTTKSWADSGLYVTTSDSQTGSRYQAPTPKTYNAYEIVIESLWPHQGDIYEASHITPSSIGLVAPSLSRQRKDTFTAGLSEVIWDAESDWALIELKDPALWRANSIERTDHSTLEITLPTSEQKPPVGEVLLATGVSGEVEGVGLGTVGGILLPWSSAEISTWSVEGEIIVGDSGALAICPQTGVAYGMIVAHDFDSMITYMVPVTSVLQNIASTFNSDPSTMSIVFSSIAPGVTDETGSDSDSRSGLYPTRLSRSGEEQPIFVYYQARLKTCTMWNVSGDRYIATSALIDWLIATDVGGSSNLDILLDAVYSEHMVVPVESREISKPERPALLTIMVLIECGRGDLIHRFLRDDLTDSRMPFSQTLLEQVFTANDVPDPESLAIRFFDSQWAYRPVVFDLGMARNLEPHAVLPIASRTRINAKGVTASIWNVTIQEEFVGEQLRKAIVATRTEDAQDKLGPRYRLAIKTFHPSYESIFLTELRAHRAMRGNTHFVSYLGDYVQTTKTGAMSHNLMLEYADSDLTEYFHTSSPPAMALDIYLFWKQMFNLCDGLQTLHSFEMHRAGRGSLTALQGYHQDLKPDNILVCNKNTFKIADFGFVNIHDVSRKNVREILTPHGGTYSYAPPEVASEYGHDIDLNQKSDVWSLGCIFSVVCTWVVLGTSGIRQFEYARESEIKSLSTDLVPLDCFHDGVRTLDTVTRWRTVLQSALRKQDFVTGDVLDLIFDGMLVQRSNRLNAHQVFERCTSILDAATALIGSEHFSQSDARMFRYYPTISTTLARERSLVKTSGRSLIPVNTDTEVVAESRRRKCLIHENILRQIDHLSVRELFNWYEKGDGWKITLPHQALANELKDRDFVFLIDDSQTMAAHWTEVVRFTGAVAKFLKSFGDADDIDFYFTISRDRTRTRHITRIKSRLLSLQHLGNLNASSDPERALHTIIDDRRKFFSRGSKGPTWLLNRSRNRRQYRLIIYVLTDGVWQPRSNISRFVKNLAMLLDEAGDKAEDSVGIQFIQFGSDELGSKRLQYLDSDSSRFLARDIIDTEPSNGNVWKMLLGSINRSFDYSDACTCDSKYPSNGKATISASSDK